MNVKSDEQMKNAMETLAGMHIFFGHQSVGQNILSGIDDIAKETGIPIQRSTVEDVADSANVNIIDARVGKNEAPGSKISDFAQMVRSGMGNSVDVAFMKFCYVDTRGQEKVESFFSNYISEMEKLEREFPETTFVYVTMPLTSPMTGLKNMIKRILGRLHKRDDGRAANVSRGRFNKMLREEKGQTGRLFDLAAVQATKPNGDRYTVTVDGEEYEALYPGYTWDGGHLDETGRKAIAIDLVIFLSKFN